MKRRAFFGCLGALAGISFFGWKPLSYFWDFQKFHRNAMARGIEPLENGKYNLVLSRGLMKDLNRFPALKKEAQACFNLCIDEYVPIRQGTWTISGG